MDKVWQNAPMSMSKQFGWRSRLGGSVTVVAIALGTWLTPAWAGDPFRQENPRNISDTTEQAFEAFFRVGDYPLAAQQVDLALSEANVDPILYAMRASLVYLEDPDNLPSEFKDYATLTLERAEALVDEDPLRGNIYIAVGHFLEGAYALKTDGIVRGVPTALSKLQQVFRHLDRATAVDPEDPELNIIKGYMDLMLATNLPFSNPERPIERLRDYAAPEYLAKRGLAVGLRDLNRFEEAMQAVDRSLELTPENPEIMYLKAQIYVDSGDRASSLPWFDRALAMQEQLPAELVRQIQRERDQAQRRVDAEQASNR
ncbi:Sll0314/Alr1548 family TPR repeat-containing protein [Geitlerinema sp. P-1104]|uniref:Sll0314/Alr1548 family TPR repeat-containing protein n=1 Tax=Geitlerinema sp. P-1104 TaxID=2546230 RepID=UPI00197E8E16|nr:Sll0314/Alr1548 family TPR repeat-containing protein [Geitlerinema sp. P-1104]